MRLERNVYPPSDQQLVSTSIAATLKKFRSRCDARGVTIETDFSDCQAVDSKAFVKAAAAGLILNALAAMPAGGELSLTLVDSTHQWELEVADTGCNPSQLGKEKDFTACEEIKPESSENNDVGLPKIIEFPATEALREVIRLAHQHRANLASFSCPLGGTAWVMIVSKYHSGSQLGASAA